MDEAGFWSRVTVKSNGCWEWTGSRDQYGYGSVKRWQGRYLGTHRVAYEMLIGPVPDGLQLDHTCHNEDLSCDGGRTCLHRRCVNPAHLVPATHKENTSRGRAGQGKKRATSSHCGNGHEYAVVGFYLSRRRRGRLCKQCVKDAAARHAVRYPDKVRERNRAKSKRQYQRKKAARG